MQRTTEESRKLEEICESEAILKESYSDRLRTNYDLDRTLVSWEIIELIPGCLTVWDEELVEEN